MFVPANGFSLGATVARPAGAGKGVRWPAVVLVGAPDGQDRNEITAGIPIFAQLAAALADDGYLTIRYDSRSVGRSGGRSERAGATEYANDLVGTIAYLRGRPDVDGRRLAVLSYGAGCAIALSAAAREDRIGAVAMLAAPGSSGRQAVLDQQTRLLSRLNLPPAEVQAKIDLETRIIDATLTGTGVDALPADARAATQSAWFKSWLQFDPAKMIPQIHQPLLILQGALDREIPPASADRLEALGRARPKTRDTDTQKVVIAGVNHAFVPASTGEADEYPSLRAETIPAAVSRAISGWLNVTLTGR